MQDGVPECHINYATLNRVGEISREREIPLCNAPPWHRKAGLCRFIPRNPAFICLTQLNPEA